jgi:hypothetical protein
LHTRSSATHNTIVTPSLDPVDEWVEEAFTRLYVQRGLLVHFKGCLELSYPPLRTIGRLPSRFHSYNLAWRHLENIYCRVFHLATVQRHQRLKHVSKQESSPQYRELGKIQTELAEWLMVYTVSAPSLIIQEPTLRADNLLSEYYNMARIMVATCLRSPSDETIYDNYTKDFLAILSTSIKLWNIRAAALPRFWHKSSLDMTRSIVDIGWLAPLYFMALKCRVRRIRWHAVQLLERTFHKEGLWDSRLCASVSRAVVQFEEPNIDGACYPRLHFALDEVPNLVDVSGPILPKERRISRVRVDLPEGPSESVTLHFKQCGVWQTSQVSLA